MRSIAGAAARARSSAGWRKVMMWWFIVTDGLLFAGFLASATATRG